MPGAIPRAMLFVLLLFPLSACAGKNTVVLETEELVDAGMESPGREAETQQGTPEGTPEGIPEGRQTQRKQVTPERQDSPAGQEIPPGQETAGASAAPVSSILYVHICGAVREPGVYGLPEGSRVYEAVREAGGFAETADENYVNLSLTLEDGWKIVIPTLKETERTAAASAADEGRNAQDNSGTGSDFAGITPKDGTAGGMQGGSRADQGTGLVDINGASEAELCTLPGIGESRAKSIIAYREQSGGFSRIEDIMKIEGIKEGMFSKLKDRICVR